MTIQEANKLVKEKLTIIYDVREATTITDWVLEKITGLPRIDRLMHKDGLLPDHGETMLHDYLEGLLAQRPVQYVLEEAHFFGLRFFVDENVLIPRPETEELVDWILKDTGRQPLSLLDIGTGSGCIAITMKSKNEALKVFACDISEAALSVASKNATTNRVDIDFKGCDILDPAQSDTLPFVDIIVSNPPYIPQSGKQTMSANVLNFEPHVALFTPADDPLIFYRAIGLLGIKKLPAGGKLYFEIHEDGAEGVTRILKEQGYKNIHLKNDLYDRPRMIRTER